MTAVGQLWGRVADRVRGAARGGSAPAIAALDIGTEFAKALVLSVERDEEGRLTGIVRGSGRQRQGLAHMQSGTVSDIDAVVANSRAAMDEARAEAGRTPVATVIGIAGELVKGATSSLTTRRDDPRRPLDEAELERLVRRAQDRALADAEERIRWESGVDRLDVRLVHAAIVEMTIDGYPVSNPIGFSGAQVELQVFNAFAPMVHLGALQSVADALELQLLGVIAEPYAVATCLDPGELGDVGAVFVDIGGGTTDVALVRGGGISGTKMLALGGRAFTKGLAERLGVSFADAERAKLAAGDGPQEVDDALLEDALIWRDGIELMIGDLAGGDLLPGPGAALRGRGRPAAGSIGPRAGRLVAAPPVRATPEGASAGARRGDGSARRDRQPRHAAGCDPDGARAPGPDPRRRLDRRRSRHAQHRARDASVSDQPAVVYLEADDEITTVVRRVRGADAQRVIVVVPGRSRATSSAVALRLLARAGEETGRDVALVGDALTRSLASEAGLTAYGTLDDARRAEPSTDEPPIGAHHAAIHVVRGTEDTVATPVIPADDVTRSVPVVRGPSEASRRRPVIAAAAAVVAVLLVLGLAGAAMLPGATVTIDPATEDVGPVPYVIEVAQPQQLSGAAEASATVTATGEYQTLEPATGAVVLFNWSAFDQAIAAGTLVAAADQAFATQADVVVPRGQLTPEGTIQAGEASVAVAASAPGPAGNVGANEIDTVLSEDADARLQGFPENGQQRVTNPEATSGGVDETGTEITQADVDAAVEALTTDLRGQVADALAEHADAIVVQTELPEPEIEGLDELAGTRDQAEATIDGSTPLGSVDHRRGGGHRGRPAAVRQRPRPGAERTGDAPREHRGRDRGGERRGAARCESTSRPPAAVPRRSTRTRSRTASRDWRRTMRRPRSKISATRPSSCGRTGSHRSRPWDGGSRSGSPSGEDHRPRPRISADRNRDRGHRNRDGICSSGAPAPQPRSRPGPGR